MKPTTSIPNFVIKKATEKDVPLILSFIKQLAEYERLAHEVVATEGSLRETLFGERPYAEVIIGYYKNQAVAFALYFHNYSTFLGRPGIYLEDLFVLLEMRGKGLGWVLDWNEPAIQFYKSLGAIPMDEWTVFRVTGEALERLAES